MCTSVQTIYEHFPFLHVLFSFLITAMYVISLVHPLIMFSYIDTQSKLDF